ncbi:hypothetical protein Leryth_017919, partial [Lithospermum erythrorhizon]
MANAKRNKLLAALWKVRTWIQIGCVRRHKEELRAKTKFCKLDIHYTSNQISVKKYSC